MIAANLLSENIPPLRGSDTIKKALMWMEEFKVTHLPVVNQKQFIGIVSESELMDISDSNMKLSDMVIHAKLSVLPQEHLFNITKLVFLSKFSIIPVVEADNTYLGCISLETLTENFCQLISAQENGGILVLEVPTNNYSLSQIASIVESNNAKVLGLAVNTIKEEDVLLITLKINQQDLTEIIQTFYRYNYKVKSSYHLDKFQDETQDRYHYLMNYLAV